ncbi:MAG: hypothetical protein ACK5MM_19345 [Planctomyces sp.]
MFDRPFLSMDLANPTWWAYVGLLVIAVYFRFSRFFSIRNLDLLLLLAVSTSLTATVLYRDRAWTVEAEGGPLLTRVNALMADVLGGVERGTIPVAYRADEVDAPGESAGVAGARGGLANQILNSSVAQRHPMYRWGSLVLLTSSACLLVRLMFDESLTRRPRLDQNLNLSGLMCLCIPAFGILMAHVALLSPPQHAQATMQYGQALLQRQHVELLADESSVPPAPVETLMAAGGSIVGDLADTEPDWVARGLVITAHSLVVLGLLVISRLHFASLQLGVSMVCLYLLLPCTGVYVHQLSHVLPAACLTWAFACYRRPTVAGILLGLASGTLFFAIFLIPLWAVFYGRRGAVRFIISVTAVAVVLAGTLMLISQDASSFAEKLIRSTNWTVYRLLMEPAAVQDAQLSQTIIRILMAAVFFVMLTAMTVLPRPRNLENLLGNSTSLIVAAQLWYPQDIGHYVLWYLPLLLLVIFRPRLDRLIPPDRLEATMASLSSVSSGSLRSSMVVEN